MYKALLTIAFMAGLLAASIPARAADPAPTAPAAKSTPSGKTSPSNARTDAAEARYRAWVAQEHAQDAAEFAKEKSKIEDKYKGYVRPKHDRKNAKGAPKVPAAETAPAKDK